MDVGVVDIHPSDAGRFGCFELGPILTVVPTLRLFSPVPRGVAGTIHEHILAGNTPT